MKKTISVAILVFVLSVSLVDARKNFLPPENGKNVQKLREIKPAGREGDLERFNFVHYAKTTSSAKIKPLPTETCYKKLGYSWKNVPVNYVINPENQDGLTEEFVVNNFKIAAENWDVAVSAELINDNYSINYNAQYGIKDNQNSIEFGTLAENNIIGVTTIWFDRRGKQIVEFDILFNEYYTWGDADFNPMVMDFQNIAVHEFGHGIGLGDVYTDTCSNVTMYGYSGFGETSKRTLELPDIQGIQSVYGI